MSAAGKRDHSRRPAQVSSFKWLHRFSIGVDPSFVPLEILLLNQLSTNVAWCFPGPRIAVAVAVYVHSNETSQIDLVT